MVNSNFEFYLPTRIKCGKGVTQTITEEIKALGKSRPLLITDKGLVNSGLADKVVTYLKDGGIEVFVFDEVQANPRDTTVHAAYDMAMKNQADIIVALGGGSAMDTSKGVGLLLGHNGGKIHDFENMENIVKPSAPIIAIPTTVGTGSEVTFWAVITDTTRKYKMGLGSALIAPTLALIDPDMVVSLPGAIVASTGMDALTHAIEGYTCKISEPITDALGLYAIELIVKNIRNATYSDNYEAKSNMLIASMIAGICFGQSDCTAVHCISETLGGLYDIPHGIANACVLPFVMEYNYVGDMEKFARVAQAMGENVAGLTSREAALKAIDAVRALNADLGIPAFRDLDIKEEDLPLVAERAVLNVSTPDNPREIKKEDFLTVLEKAWSYDA